MASIVIVFLILGIVGGGVLTYLSKDSDIALDKSIYDKVRELPSIYARAHKSIKIATDFDSKFFDDQRVSGAIEKAIGNGAKVMFLSEGEPPAWYKNKSGVDIKQVKSLTRHTMIIDEYHVRLEQPHEKLTFGGHKGDIALILKGFPQLGERLSSEFDDLWASS